MQTLEVRMTHTLARLRRTAQGMGAWSLDRSEYSYAEIADAVRLYEAKLNQLDRLRSINKRNALTRSEYLTAHKIKQQRRSQVALARNKAKRDRKQKRREYRVYKEHRESQDKRDRKKFGLIGWAVLCVGDSSIAANLRRRLESAMSPDGRISSDEIDRVFWVVGGSKPYKDDIVRRIAHIIDEPEDLTIYAHQWNACTNLEQKQTLLDAWLFTTDKLIVIKDLAGTIRREKRYAPTTSGLQ